ncbi:MAG: prepilin-type N-terminal cleavage/methylation domain-containing protein [Candidatus Hydrogenedentes bacterium]|nr:prepilin-type N-terminal cleavage/methylation domain-containing protein [Candidatus Hydrogenedentota bacterium]
MAHHSTGVTGVPAWGRASGFTLLEMLVALAVLAVATGVIAALFSASLGLSANSRHQRIASALAEEQLCAVVQHPEQYRWPLGRAGDLELFEVQPRGAATAPALGPPSALPAVRNAAVRTDGEYAQFSSQVYGRLPAKNAQHVEVTVVVRWMDAGRAKLVALTSAVPRMRLEQAP